MYRLYSCPRPTPKSKFDLIWVQKLMRLPLCVGQHLIPAGTHTGQMGNQVRHVRIVDTAV
jgi:hypothetical protein